MSLVCVGDNVADYYYQKEEFFPGGSAYNVAVLSQRLGMETAYIGRFGNDGPGEYLLDFLQKENVDISHVEVGEGSNAFSVVKKIAGESKITKVDKGVYKNFSLDNSDLNFIKNFDLMHTTLYSYTEKYLSFFREEDINISFDFSFCRDFNYLKKLVPDVNLAFFSSEGEDQEKIKELMSSIYDLGADYVIFTLGKEGVLVLVNNQFHYQKAKKTKIIDPLGAGDAFISMFLNDFISNHKVNDNEQLKNYELKKILKKSVDFAAKNCRHYGTIKIRRE